jgi:acyl-CoA reductase-like NAD-dependent aldehyde dehydrogenase
MANAGQICVVIKRAYVPSAMYDETCDDLARLATETVVDDWGKQGTTVGPIQNRMEFEKVLALIEDARGRGTILAGGETLDRRAISSRRQSCATSMPMRRWFARSSWARSCRYFVTTTSTT